MKCILVGFQSLLSLGLGIARAEAQEGIQAQPDAQPTAQPPTPPEQLPPPPQQQAPIAAQPQAAATGQWVSTAQYGWIWIPYGQQYTYEPADEAAVPYEYVYSA